MNYDHRPRDVRFVPCVFFYAGGHADTQANRSGDLVRHELRKNVAGLLLRV